MFRELLSTASQVKLQLIESLLNDSHCFIADLLAEFDLSLSLFRKYVTEINHDLSFLKISIDAHSLVSLELHSFAARSDVYSFFLAESSAFKLLELLFSSHFSSYETLAIELNLSKSSIIRLIKKINLEIQPYDFHIEKKPIRLAGNEINIRQFYAVFFLEKYQHEFRDASKNQEQEFLKIAQLFAAATPLKLYFSDIRKIAFIIYVHSRRDRLFASKPAGDKIEYFLERIDLADFSHYQRSYLEKVMGYLTSHITADPTIYSQVRQTFLHLTKQIFDKYDYEETDFQEKLTAVTFKYLLETNLNVPYCILNDRLARFAANCDYAQQAVNREIIRLVTHSELPAIRPATINHLIYIFHTSFPLFAKQIIDQHANYHLALLYDTNGDHTEMIRTQIKQFVPYDLTITILNPLDSFSIPAVKEPYDLIIGNIVPPSQKIPFKATDIFITREEIGFIARNIQEKAIQQIEKKPPSNLH
ncbi:helix-turn-helix domain-containing protein [Enterococcus sp.]|uniref:helix-turn-helix domain-containing protein n=1 Tax=Enterococcus sp. TaxID=35783 RepID=UPI0025B884C5|nr:helix-turn-helix domain-containing protein [Enterococcus sp.]